LLKTINLELAEIFARAIGGRRTSNWLASSVWSRCFSVPTILRNQQHRGRRSVNGLFEMGFSELGAEILPAGRPAPRRSTWRAHENG